MQYSILGMKTLNISQGAYSNYTHKNLYQYDLTGEDAGKDVWRVKTRVKCLNILSYNKTGFANTIFFGTCDENGNQAKVRTPSGDKVLTYVMTHMDNIYSHVKVGGIYTLDQFIYLEGVKGNASGNHIHLEIGEGWVTNKVKKVGDYYGGYQWCIEKPLPIEENIYLLEGYNRIFNDKGYNFQWVKTIDVEDNSYIVIDNKKYIVDDISSKYAILKAV